VPTATGQKTLGAPWNMSRHWRLERKDLIQATRYVETPPLARTVASLFAQTLSNPPLTSRKRVETLKAAAWSRQTSWVRVATASKQPRPARDPHWLGCKRPRERVAEARRRAESLARILETVSSRTMMQKEEGVR